MLYRTKNIALRDGTNAVFRSPEAADAREMNEFLKKCFSETDYLIRYPEEWTQTEESEARFLEDVNASQHTLMIVCTIDGVIAGNCSLMFMQGRKREHRASIALGILKKYWGLGIGSAMISEMIRIAGERGILQLELDYIEGNERACGLYEKMGFVHVGEKPDAIRLKDGTMLKEYSMVRKL